MAKSINNRFDLSGKIIFTTGVEAGESQVVKLPDLEKGIYCLKVLTDNFSYGTKIIVVD